MIYFSPADVAAVVYGGARARTLPDAIYDAALKFAKRHGYIKVIGQYSGPTRAGKRYLRRYGVA